MRATKQNGAAKQGVQGLYAMAAFVLLLTLSGTAAAQVTEWSREASSPGNWATAANWSNGVPQAGYMVNVTNGGTAIINSAAASAKNLLINNSSTVEQNIYSLTLIGSAYSPALTVEGGQYRLNSGSLSVSNSIGVGEYVTASFYQGTGRVLATGQSIWLGWNNTSTGYWDLAGSGSITCNKLYLGNYGSGYFTQSAGKVTADELQMGIFRSAGADPHGQYSLHGGELQVRNLEVGMQGSALFRQSNSSVASTGILSIGTYQYDRDGMRSYELSGGTLNSTRVITGTKSQFLQTGGTHNTKYYQIGSDHLYNYTGGEFNINGGLRLEGALDFGNQLRTLNLTRPW